MLKFLCLVGVPHRDQTTTTAIQYYSVSSDVGYSSAQMPDPKWKCQPRVAILDALFSYFCFVQAGIIVDARLKELTPAVPVIFIKAIPVDKQETRNVYQCPVYKTRQRGPTYVWTFNLKTKESPSKWTLAGVALLLQI